MEWYELWVLLRLDAFQAMFATVIAVFGIFGTFGVSVLWAGHEEGKCTAKVPTIVTVLWVVALLIGTIGAVLTPTTKQAAVIFLAPKIASQKNIDFATDEAKELYGLAKEYLKSGVEEKNGD